MRYLLSKVLPVPMRSRYLTGADGDMHAETARWWQWRGHVFATRITPGF